MPSACAGVVVAAAILTGHAIAQAESASHWLTGPALQKQLRQPIDVVWAGNPLRSALMGLAQSQHVSILIDRRVDPEQKLQLKLDHVPLASALQTIAADRHLGVAILDGLVYLGPPWAGARVRTVAALRSEEARRLPPGPRRKFFDRRAMSWSDFSTPRQVLQQLTQSSDLQLNGLDTVPHDLWAAADVPPLPLIDRLTVIAVQFDLTFAIDPEGTSITLVPLPEDLALVRNYPGGSDPQVTGARYAELVPGARVKVVGNRVYVKGLLEEHERIAARKPPDDRTPPKDATPAMTRIDKMAVQEIPLGPLLEQLAQRLDLELRIDPQSLRDAGASLDHRVSVNVHNVTVDELLREVLRSTPLTFRRTGNVVEIVPAK